MKSLSCVRLFVTPWTVAYQAPLSIRFSRQLYWSGLPFPSPGDLPNPGIKPRSSALQTDTLPSEPPGKNNLQIYCDTFQNIHSILHYTRINNPKIFLEPQKTQSCQAILRKRTKLETTLLEFRLYYKATVSKQHGIGTKQTYRSMEQNSLEINVQQSHSWPYIQKT